MTRGGSPFSKLHNHIEMDGEEILTRPEDILILRACRSIIDIDSNVRGFVKRVGIELRQHGTGIENITAGILEITTGMLGNLGTYNLGYHGQCRVAFFNAVRQQHDISMIKSNLKRMTAVANTGNQTAESIEMMISHPVNKIVVEYPVGHR